MRDTAPPCHEEESEEPATERGPEPAATGEATVLLGHRESGDEPVIWRPSIRANPHLMILGQPGMGKTTTLINCCLQLQAQGVTPIVFSYHEDIDGKLTWAGRRVRPVWPRRSAASWIGCVPRKSPTRACKPCSIG